MAHLPGWVQTVWQATVYAEETGDAALGELPRYAFLRVRAASAERLEVETLAGTKNAPLAGWVEPNDVQPSEPGDGWLQNHQSTLLFSGPGVDAEAYLEVQQWTYVRQLGESNLGRVPVRVYYGDLSDIVGDGWLSEDAIGPVAPPDAAVLPTNSGSAKENPFAGDSWSFITAVASAARESSAQSGVPVSLTVAQAILESSWGDSLLTRRANNLFGMKALGGLGNDGVVWMLTSEYDGAGNLYDAYEPFRAYRSLSDSIADHDRLLTQLERYRPALEASDNPHEFAYRLMEGGYSTDPYYADKLISLMDTYDLYVFDG